MVHYFVAPPLCSFSTKFAGSNVILSAWLLVFQVHQNIHDFKINEDMLATKIFFVASISKSGQIETRAKAFLATLEL